MLTNSMRHHHWGIFKEGFFEVASLEKAVEYAEKLLCVKLYFSDYKDRYFVRAMIHCFGMDEYDHNKFLRKLSYQGNSIVKCVDKKSYLRRIEAIYNKKDRATTKSIRLF